MKLRLLASAAALALTLTACGSAGSSVEADATDAPTDDATSAATPTDEPTEPTEPTATEPSEAPESEPADSGDLTPPGTELGLGEWATVPFKYGTDSEGVLRVRVVGVEKGNESDLSVFNQETRDKLKGLSPRYVRIEVEQASGGTLEYASAGGNFQAVTASGERARELTAFGTFEPCDSESFPSGWGPGSPAVKVCVIGLVGAGSPEVAGAQYHQRESDYDSYDGKPVIWK